MALTATQKVLLVEAYLCEDEWYEHGMASQAARALASTNYVAFRHGSGDKQRAMEAYIFPAIQLTSKGRKEADKLLREKPELRGQALQNMQARKEMKGKRYGAA